jgi:diguanylate cyclase (GGDEF)-like protein
VGEPSHDSKHHSRLRDHSPRSWTRSAATTRPRLRRPPIGDDPVELSTGAPNGKVERITSASRTLDGDQLRADPERSLADPGQTGSDSEQTVADSDQTGSDIDQTAADSDQAAADSDQAAADSDQEASDRNLFEGGDPRVHELTRDLRDRGTEQRQESARRRVEAAAVRDAVAHARDLAALERDQAAELRDRELAERDAAWEHDGRALTGADILLRAAENRKRAASDRAAAATGRARAALDREQAARDREQASRDRLQAQADRQELLHQLAIAETDALTGTRTRGAGLADLEHELDRARRTGGTLVVAYVDVVGLKAVNDRKGHTAGDAVLRRTVREVRGHMRSYDLMIRLGGDEFLCVMSGATIEHARLRFDAVDAALSAGTAPCAIKVGFAALGPDDSVTGLIARADRELPGSRR